jgi:hypothetical protein
VLNLTRRQNWPELLGAYIVANMARPHAWGSNDCVTFARGAVEAITGTVIELPCTWADEAQALAALDALGGLQAAVDTVLPRLPSPAYAQRGDIVMLTVPSRPPWIAVCSEEFAWAPSISGLAQTSIGLAITAWSVGHG